MREHATVELKRHLRRILVVVGGADVMEETYEKECFGAISPIGEVLLGNGLTCGLSARAPIGRIGLYQDTKAEDSHAVVESLLGEVLLSIFCYALHDRTAWNLNLVHGDSSGGFG